MSHARAAGSCIQSGMRANQLFLRDLIGIAVAVAAVTTVGLTLAPRTPVPTAPATSSTLESRVPAGSPPQAHRGASLFENKGCVACHSVDGTTKIGPSMLHAYGSQVTLDDGRVVAMDDVYIRESVLLPRAKSRAGYPPTMPSFDGMLDDRDINAIVGYLRSLK